MLNKKYIVILLSFFLIDCAMHNVNYKASLKNKALFVVNFEHSQIKYEKGQKGWWLGAEDIYKPANLGYAIAELLRAKLYDNGYKVINFPEFLLFRKNYLKKHKEAKDYSPIEWAKVIGADYLVSGKIIKAYTYHNRTFHNWKVSAIVSFYIKDVSSDKIIFSKRYKINKSFASLVWAFSKITDEIVSDMNKL